MNILDIAIAKQLASGGGGSGTDNYNDLLNLPQINGETLAGNKSSSNLGLQDEIDSDNKLASDLVDDENQENKFVTSSEKNTWNAKQNAIDSDHKLDADLVDDSESTNKFVTASDKEAWNAKQNAIDADHKLSSSLVSFSTAEAAALASGIDSTKVGQISTNQTNILYALEVGAKNLFRWDKWVSDCTVVGGTKTISSGVMTLTSSSTNCYTEYEGSAYPDVEIPVKENEQYVMTWENWRLYGSARGTVYVVFVGSTGAATASASAEVKKIEFTTPAGTTGLRVYIKQTANVLSENYSDFMICSKAIWDTLGHNYQPPSVSNYELTKLESEDRAALVEVIDSGAKNKLKLDKDAIKSLNSGDTWSGYVYTPTTAPNLTVTINDDGTVTLNGSTSSSLVTVALERKASSGFQGYVLSGSKANTKLVYQLAVSPYTVYATADGVGSDVIANYTDGSTIQLSLQIVANSTFSNTVITPMICTEADWKISQNYAPFALPNTDLTRMVETLLPTSYTAPVVNSDISSKLSILSGGYAKAGNLVTVNIRLSVTDTISAGSALFTGLPAPKTTATLSYGSAVVPVTNMCVNAQVSPNVMLIDTQGAIRLAGTPVSSDITTGIYILSATYLSA